MNAKSGPPLEEQIHFVKSTEMDIFTAVEAGVQLPIAFRDKAALEAWAEENNLTVESIGRRRKAHVVRGQIFLWGHDDGLEYAQIWVALEYRAYRAAMRAHVAKREGSEKDIHLYDCDHAVSRTRLRKVWPNAWVSLILVKRSLNRAIGAMMEKSPLHVTVDQDRLDLDAEAVLKALYNKAGRLTADDLAHYLRSCRERFLTLPSGEFRSNDPMAALQLYFMTDRADTFFARIAEKHELDVSAVIPKKKFAVLQ